MKERVIKALFRMTDKMESHCGFKSIRQGMIMLIPLLVVSSVALTLRSLPIPVYQEFLSKLLGGRVVEVLEFISQGVFQFYAVILAVITSISYATLKRKQAKEYVGFGEVIILSVITLAALAGYSGIQYDTFSVSELSNLNTFTALFVTLISGKIFFFIKDRKIFRIKKQGTNNDAVYMDAVEGIVPAIIILLFFALFHQVFRTVFQVNSLQELLEIIINRFLTAFDNGLGVGISVLLLHTVCGFSEYMEAIYWIR